MHTHQEVIITSFDVFVGAQGHVERKAGTGNEDIVTWITQHYRIEEEEVSRRNIGREKEKEYRAHKFRTEHTCID